MYAEILDGTHRNLAAIIEPIPSDKHQELVLIKDIPFHSMCEHHLTPFFGFAHVAYIPSKCGKIAGLSKLARLVRVAAARLQLQERLTSTHRRHLGRDSRSRRGAGARAGGAPLHVYARRAHRGVADGHLRGAGHLPYQLGHPGRGAGPDRGAEEVGGAA